MPFPETSEHNFVQDMRILDALRHKTGDAHERLHTHPALIRLTQKEITLPYYQNVLSRFYGFHAPLENALVNTKPLPALESYFSRHATKRLEKDLDRWDINAENLPSFKDAPAHFSAEQAAGYLYLREGATLGGQYISKQLEKSLRLEREADVFYFSGYGKDTGASWRNFREALSCQNIDASLAAQYSATLFEQLDAWLLEGLK